MPANPLTAIRFRDVFLRPARSAFARLPAGLASDGVRSLTNRIGLIPQKSGPKLQRIGRKLFRTIVPNPDALSRRLKQQQQRRDGFHTRIWIELHEPSADAQPWELLCDPAAGPSAFLACERTTPIVRTLHKPKPGDRLEPLDGPMRILGVIAAPQGRPHLAVKKEKAALRRAVAEPLRLGLVELRWVEGKDTANKLRRALRQPWHVIHFIGHGDFDSAQDLGVLAFEDADGRENQIPANLVRALLAGTSVRMVVLNTCRGAFTGKGGVLTSIAARLALQVPAVIGMQAAISDRAAVEFSRELYESLTQGLPVELAVTNARLALAMMAAPAGGRRVIEWPAPVLYLSSMHDILNLQTVKARPAQLSKPERRKARRLRMEAAAVVDPALAVAVTSGKPRRTPPPPDDPQKYQWGGSPSSNGRTISAAVKGIDNDWYRIQLTVTTDRGAKPLEGPVTFHLHDSFADPVQTVQAEKGVAKLTLVAYGAFTVGVEADGGKTKLELDLAELESAPKKFREL